jgi:hypothetical protein
MPSISNYSTTSAGSKKRWASPPVSINLTKGVMNGIEVALTDQLSIDLRGHAHIKFSIFLQILVHFILSHNAETNGIGKILSFDLQYSLQPIKHGTYFVEIIHMAMR